MRNSHTQKKKKIPFALSSSSRFHLFCPSLFFPDSSIADQIYSSLEDTSSSSEEETGAGRRRRQQTTSTASSKSNTTETNTSASSTSSNSTAASRQQQQHHHPMCPSRLSSAAGGTVMGNVRQKVSMLSGGAPVAPRPPMIHNSYQTYLCSHVDK